jgi:DNA-binding beta-propeller fold protein YncE
VPFGSRRVICLTLIGNLSSAGRDLGRQRASVAPRRGGSGAALDCGSEPATLTRLAFDAQGSASVAGTVTPGMTGADRGIAWDPKTRTLFVSQCGPAYAIQHYHVATDHTVTSLAPITGTGIYNPGGMIVAPWGELLVANEGTAATELHGNSLSRFSLDAQGNVTANGTITGSALDSPFGLAFAPWGDLFVFNNSNATLARFAFDASHAATQTGAFQLARHKTTRSIAAPLPLRSHPVRRRYCLGTAEYPTRAAMPHPSEGEFPNQ